MSRAWGRACSAIVEVIGATAAVAATDSDSAMTTQWYTTAAMERQSRGEAIAVRELGHVSFFVRDLDAARRFWSGILGLQEIGTGKNGRIVFFSAGRHHHDVSCELARAEGPPREPHGVPGLYHVAFQVGESLDDLASARHWVEAHELTPFGETATSFCVRDPDGHMVELYVISAQESTARAESLR